MIGRNDLCWCGSRKKWKKCHFPEISTSDADFASIAKKYRKQWGILLKNPDQIQKIRKACHLTASILDEVADRAKEGVTTNALNIFAQEKIIAAGASPASLGYGVPPFPKTLCTSLNEVVCHGIPDDRPLTLGDIVNIDLALIYEGYFGDCSKMVAIGPVSKEKKLVFDVAHQCLNAAISQLRPGLLLSEIGETIQHIADKHNCGVVSQFVGHGVGLRYHEPPQVPHCRNMLHIPLTPGMIFTIEPMINFGTPEAIIDPSDHWTARTADGEPSAQWEHTILITETSCEILTPWKHSECVAIA